jgi:DNA-binding transcriptional LysR family regulator
LNRRSQRSDPAAGSADSPELRTEPFSSDHFHLVCPAGHALAKRRKVKLAELARYPIVQLARSSSVRQYLDRAAGFRCTLPTFFKHDPRRPRPGARTNG